MKAILSIVIAASAGCSGVTQSGTAPGDDDGSDMGSDAPQGIGELHGSILDERNDQIEFSSGEPVHAHGGAPVDLASGCPAVYKFGYLTSVAGPTFGHELSANPLAWKIETDPATTDASASAYRVRGVGRIVHDWIPIAPDEDGAYSIALHRDGAQGVPEIATQSGMMWLEVRLRDTGGIETIKSACWDNHPLAAPLSFAPAARGGLFDESFAAHSPISMLLNVFLGGIGNPVVTIPFQQMTKEPIELAFDLGTLPSGTGTKEVVNAYIPTSPTAVVEPCSACGANEPTPTRNTQSAPIAGKWRMAVINMTTGAVVCQTNAGSVTLTGCTIPARGAIQDTYELILALAEEPSITPEYVGLGASKFVDTFVGGRWLTGIPDPTTYLQACSHHWIGIDGTPHCNEVSSYKPAVVLDQATLALAPIHFAITTGVSASLMAAAPYVQDSTASFAAATWDAGNAGF